MAEVDQTYSELEQEYLSEAGVKLEHEVEPKPELVPEPAHGLLQADEHEEKDHKTVDGIEENSHHHDEEQDHVVEPVTGGADKWPGWPGENIYRILVSAQKVGGIIGRKGEYIKKTCEETKARIKVLDGPPGTRERAVMISGKEDPDNPLPPAINGLLSVHKRVLDGLDSDSSTGGKVATRLLLPAAQAGSLIGKQGSTVKSVQDESNCIVRVLSEEDLPVFALQDDRVVEVVGEPADIHKAIELIASHLRKFLVDRSIIPIIEMQMQMPNPPQMEHMPPPAQHWGPPPPPQSFAQSGGHPGPGYGGPNPHFMPPPPRQFDNYYPPPDMPPPLPEKQPHQGISAFGRELPMPVHSSSAQPTSSIITQVTQQMQIPLSYADAVIGTQGSTISYIRRVSGATVTIQESRGAPTEMTVEISGSASQVQTAQQLIQNFMSGAAGQTNAPPPGEQQYNSYGYTSAAPSSQSQGGGYAGQGYGTNYGY